MGKKKCLTSLRFGVVNFEHHFQAAMAVRLFHGKIIQGKPIQVEWSDAAQGHNVLIEKYRNSAVMHESVPEVHKPAIFCNTRQLAFPPPTKHLEAPSAVVFEEHDAELCTTVVFRQLPESMTRTSLQTILEQHGWTNTYTFVYVPMRNRKSGSSRYAIVNFATHRLAKSAKAHFHGTFIEARQVAVEWSSSHRGHDALVEKYRNSAVMHDVPDEHRPAIFSNGSLVQFPSPTQVELRHKTEAYICS